MSDKFSAADILSATNANRMWRAQSVEGLNAGETINGATLPVAVYQSTADNEFYACDGNDDTKLEFVGFAISNGTDGNTIEVQFSGLVKGFSGLTEGTRYYVQDDKTIGTTIGTYEVLVGIAVSETELCILHGNFEYCGTATDTDSSGPFTPSITTPACARVAIVDVYMNETSGDDRDTRQQVTLTRNGLTTAYVADAIGVSNQAATISWSSNTISLTGGAQDAVTITGYFYK